MDMDARFRPSGQLSIRLFQDGELVKDYGVVSTQYVTDAYAKYLIDAHQGLVSGIGDFKYHDSGTGTTVADAEDTVLETPTGMAREEGSQTEGASAIIYRTIATILYDGTYQITEWGLFNGATISTLLDRATFTAVPTVLNSEIEFTYELTALSGG